MFTPLEYGCIGMTEEDAIKKFGDDVDIYHNYIHYLESTLVESAKPSDYYAKLITRPSLNVLVLLRAAVFPLLIIIIPFRIK